MEDMGMEERGDMMTWVEVMGWEWEWEAEDMTMDIILHLEIEFSLER